MDRRSSAGRSSHRPCAPVRSLLRSSPCAAKAPPSETSLRSASTPPSGWCLPMCRRSQWRSARHRQCAMHRARPTRLSDEGMERSIRPSVTGSNRTIPARATPQTRVTSGSLPRLWRERVGRQTDGASCSPIRTCIARNGTSTSARPVRAAPVRSSPSWGQGRR